MTTISFSFSQTLQQKLPIVKLLVISACDVHDDIPHGTLRNIYRSYALIAQSNFFDLQEGKNDHVTGPYWHHWRVRVVQLGTRRIH
jgi:hypothetical protein